MKGGGGGREGGSGELDARAKRGGFPSPLRAPLALRTAQVPYTLTLSFATQARDLYTQRDCILRILVMYSRHEGVGTWRVK